MKPSAIAFLTLFALAACWSSPPGPHAAAPPLTPEHVAQTFAATLAPSPSPATRDQAQHLLRSVAAAALDPVPRPAEVLSTSRCSVTVVGHLGAVRTRDGSWLVQVPPTGASVVAYLATVGSAGAALNVRGTNQADIHTQQIALPRAVVPCDALIVASTTTGSREAYWAAPGRSAVAEMLAVVFVPYAVHEGLLRPPAIGDSWLARYFRSVPIPESAVDLAKLPSVVNVQTLGVDWAAWGAAEPTIDYLTALLRPFAGDVFDGWSTDTRTPDLQHNGYGSAYASVVSQAMVQLCSTAPAAEKRALALAVVQRGLDLVGAWCDGRRNYPLGGHSAGRKALVVACGHLLGVEPFADPGRIVGPVFQEDGAFTPGEWWFGAGWTAVWRYRVEPVNSTLASPPAAWGAADATQHDTLAWMVAGYMPQVVGAQVGTALAMRLLGRTREWSTSADAMVSQWMQGPPPAAKAQLDATGLTFPWSTDYAMVRGAGFCAAAWRSYVTANASK